MRLMQFMQMCDPTALQPPRLCQPGVSTWHTTHCSSPSMPWPTAYSVCSWQRCSCAAALHSSTLGATNSQAASGTSCGHDERH